MSTIKKLKPEEFSEARKEAMQELESENKVQEAPKVKEVVKVEPDKNLIADIVKLYAKYYERARIETMMYYWELGKRLNKEYGKPISRGEKQYGHGHAQIGIKGFVSFKDSRRQLIKKLKEIGIQICERNISYARKFAFKYPQVKELIKQQDMTWDKVKTKLLLDKNKQPKLTYDSKVFTRWNDVSNGFFKILDQLNFKEIKSGEKEEYLKILRRTKQKLEKRIKELEE